MVESLPAMVDAPAPNGALARMAAKLPDTILFQLRTRGPAVEDRELLFVGGNVERLLGLPHATVMGNGMLVYGLIEQPDLVRLQAAEIAAVMGMKPLRMRVRFRLADGARRCFDISAAPTREPDGAVLWDGAASDVTEVAERTAERDRLTAIVEAADDLIAIVRPDGSTEYLNPAGRRLLGVDEKGPPPPAFALWPGGRARRRLAAAIRAAGRDGLWRGEAVIRRADGVELPVSQALVAHRDDAGDVTHYSAIMRDVTRAASTERALREAGERTSIELREVGHRVKNLFALVPAIISLSARTADSKEALAAGARQRVEALGRAHASTLHGTDGTDLASLVHAVVAPYREAGARVEGGPSLSLRGNVASAIGLTLHELATNAVKYGALSVDGGEATVRWHVTDGGQCLALVWKEAHGPVVRVPETSGFGTALIDRLVDVQGGRIERDWRPDGLVVTVSLDLED